jgi:hypothetical protein
MNYEYEVKAEFGFASRGLSPSRGRISCYEECH